MHAVIFFNLINFGLGVFMFTLCANLYLVNRVRILKYLLSIQSLILFFNIYNLLWYYCEVNLYDVLRTRAVFLGSLSYAVFLIAALIFCYFFLMFIHGLFRISVKPAARKTLLWVILIISLFWVCISLLMYFDRSQQIARFMFHKTKYLTDWILISLACYVTLLVIIRRDSIDHFIVKKALHWLLFFLALFFALKGVHHFLLTQGRLLHELTDYHLFHFIWHAMGISLFFRHLKYYQASEKVKAAQSSFLSSFQAASQDLAEAISKYEKSGIQEEYGQRIFRDLESLMRSKRPYLDPDLSLQALADTLQVSRHHLSQVINRYASKRYNDYINGYRIDEVLNMLHDPAQREKKTLEIALDAGFNSKSAFNNAFKKATGMNPK
ncbi:MAG: helix-turn-helix domain-containing protein, partial [Desulfobacteraceae bacterium]